MAINMQNGLFGLGGFGGGMPQMPQQMAGLYDPQAARRGKLKSVLTQTGLAMLGQGPSAMPINFGTSLGQGLMAGVKAGDETENQYRDMAYQTFKINQDAENQKYARGRDGINDSWAQKKFEEDKRRWEAEMKIKAADNGGNGYFGTPLPINGPDGNFVGYGLPSKDGNFKPLKAPDGTSFASPFDKSYNTKLGGELGKGAADKKLAFPKASAASAALDMQWSLVDSTIDKALSDLESGYLRTGFTGSVLGGVAGTPQYDLAQKLETIKANVGFDKLQTMRENSPTGGALGQVSDFENKLLQAVQGSLQQGQSTEQLRDNLLEVKNLLGQMKAYKDNAFARDYGDVIGGASPIPPPIDAGGKSLKQKYGLE